MKRAFWPLLLATPLSAAAFFDDFNGPEFEPHWDIFSEYGVGWEYNFSDSALHVTRLYSRVGGNLIWLAADLPRFTDFEFTARVGWDAGDSQALYAGVSTHIDPHGPFGAYVMSYVKSPGEPGRIRAVASRGGLGNEILAPISGMHVFQVRRIGDLVTAHFDGELMLEGRDEYLDPANVAFLGLGGPDSTAFAPLHTDYVEVVPEPATLIALAAGLSWLLYGHGVMRSLSDRPGKV